MFTSRRQRSPVRRSPLLVVAVALALVTTLVLPAAAVTAPAEAGPADGAQGTTVPGRVLVGLEPGTDHVRADAAVRGAGGEVARRIPALDVVVVEVPSHAETRVLAALRDDPHVAYAELDRIAEAAYEPNDPAWPDQWGPKRVSGPDAWPISTGDPDVVIAVLDTGVEADHADLAGGVLTGRDIISGDDDPSDDNGHGTGAAGVAAARSDNGIGVASLCWTCSILPVKVLDHDGDGTLADVAEGIVWAADNGADVINLSLGADGGTTTLRNAVRYAHDQGAVLVASAGNEGEETALYPAAYPEVIGVAGSRTNDTRYPWSNHGDEVDLAAPGCNITTFVGNTYIADYCGTSSATPVVAGIAGLAAAAHPEATGEQIRTAMAESAVAVAYVAHGRVDAHATLLTLGELLADNGDTTPPLLEDLSFTPATVDASDGSGSATFTLHLTDDDSGVASAALALESPSGAQTLSALITEPSSGDTNDGIWETSFTWDDNAEAGTWVVTTVELADEAGNAATHTTGDLGADGHPTEIEIVTEEPDTTPPQLEELSFTPTSVEVSDGSATATFTLHLTDDISGVADGYLRLDSPSGDASKASLVTDLVAGDPNDGVWETTITWNDDDEAGTWRIGRVDATDEAGNTAIHATDDLEADGHDTEIEVVTPPDAPTIKILGGTGAVSQTVEDDIAALTATTPTRLSGPNRYATAATTVTDAFPDPVDTVYIATGTNFPDALAAGPAAAATDAPLLLVHPDHLPDTTADELQRLLD